VTAEGERPGQAEDDITLGPRQRRAAHDQVIAGGLTLDLEIDGISGSVWTGGKGGCADTRQTRALEGDRRSSRSQPEC
jgi:hypothetical protein